MKRIIRKANDTGMNMVEKNYSKYTHHPNIISLGDLIQIGNAYYLVCVHPEYVVTEENTYRDKLLLMGFDGISFGREPKTEEEILELLNNLEKVEKINGKFSEGSGKIYSFKDWEININDFHETRI